MVKSKGILKVPKNEGWIVAWRDEQGNMYATDYVYKSKRHAQMKADELMLEKQKYYFITECIY